MRAGNSLYVSAGSSTGLVQAPPLRPCSFMREVKPKRALLTQASMGIQPIANFGIFVFMWAKLMRQYIECMRNAVSFTPEKYPLFPIPLDVDAN